MLINTGVYWDDWCLYNMSYEGIKEQFVGNGGFYMAPIHFFLQNISACPPLLCHILTFAVYFLVVVFFYLTLPYLKVEENKQFILTAFFAVIPVNAVRICMICFPYTIGLLFCFLAIYLFTIAFYKKRIIIRIISVLSCICSFLFLPSTFIFIPAYIAFVIIINETDTTLSFIVILRKIIVKSLKYADFIIVTLGSWIWLSIYAKPTGLYAAANYNSITWKAIVMFPVNLIKTVINSFVPLINFPDKQSTLLLFGCLLVLIVILFYKKSVSFTTENKCTVRIKNKTVIFSKFSLSGLYFFIAGAFAYIAVNKIPVFSGYNSRHQILLGIGISLLLLDFLRYYINPKYTKSAFIILITSFIIINIDNCLTFQRLHYKQLALMEEMRKNEEIVNNNNFIIHDNTKYYNEPYGIAFYAWTGMAKKVFGNETRVIVDKASYNQLIAEYIDINVFKSVQYNMKDISFNNTFDYYIDIDEGEINLLGNKTIIKLIIEEYFFKQQFERDIDKILTIQCVPYEQ
jgi:hypothetical protein